MKKNIGLFAAAACALAAAGIAVASGEGTGGRAKGESAMQLVSLTVNLEDRIQAYRPGQEDEKVYDSRWDGGEPQAARSDELESADEVYLEVYLEPNV